MKDEKGAPTENSGENTRGCRGRVENLRPYQWKKGQPSPNPGGRPRKAPVADAYARQVEAPLPDDIRARLKLPKGATWADAMALGQLRSAVKGNTAAAREIADRVEGRARLPVEVETPEDGQVRIEIVHVGGVYKEPTDGSQDKQAGSQNPAPIKPYPG